MIALGVPFVVTVAVLTLLLFAYLGVLFSDLAARPVVPFALAVFALHSLYNLGTRSGGILDPQTLKLAGFLAAPMALAAVAKALNRPVPSWLDLCAVALIWLPFETGFLSDVWAWPPDSGSFLNGLFALPFAAMLFVGNRGLDGVQVRLRWSFADVRRALLSLAAFVVFAVPFGLWTGFMEFNPQADLGKIIGAPFAIFFFIAIPEEFLFRGLMQNILARKWARPDLALVVTSLFFGATHLNNTPTPDWRFFVLASAAGLLYGYNYMKSKSLLGPALLHALVDAVWMLLLMSKSMQAGSPH